MKIGYFSPSYRRGHLLSITQKNYPFVKIVCMESEAQQYRQNGNDVITCPDNQQGNVCRVLNWILDTFLHQYDCIVILDDDVSSVGYWKPNIVDNQQKHKYLPDELEEFCEMNAIMCKDAGKFFWGLNCKVSRGFYREYLPFGFLQFIGGPFRAHMAGDELRYDESLYLKEDYDMTLQQIHKNKGVFRVNYAFYIAKQSKQVGGCATHRNLEVEKAKLALLQKKWGTSVISIDTKSKRSFDYNPLMNIPFRGV